MLDLFTKHGMFDITLLCKGDLNVDDHHTTEDVALRWQTPLQALSVKRKVLRGTVWRISHG